MWCKATHRSSHCSRRCFCQATPFTVCYPVFDVTTFISKQAIHWISEKYELLHFAVDGEADSSIQSAVFLDPRSHCFASAWHSIGWPRRFLDVDSRPPFQQEHWSVFRYFLTREISWWWQWNIDLLCWIQIITSPGVFLVWYSFLSFNVYEEEDLGVDNTNYHCYNIRIVFIHSYNADL